MFKQGLLFCTEHFFFLFLEGALSYAELGTMITRSGGEYAYLREAFHPVFAYLFAFIQTLMLKPSTAAIISLTCGEYIAQSFFDDGCGQAPGYIVKCMATVVVRKCKHEVKCAFLRYKINSRFFLCMNCNVVKFYRRVSTCLFTSYMCENDLKNKF